MKTDWFTVFIACIFTAAATLASVRSFEEDSGLYKQGQIDAMNGKILYELKENTDGTSSWVKMK